MIATCGSVQRCQHVSVSLGQGLLYSQRVLGSCALERSIRGFVWSRNLHGVHDKVFIFRGCFAAYGLPACLLVRLLAHLPAHLPAHLIARAVSLAI